MSEDIYQKLRESHQLDVPERFNAVRDIVDVRAAADSDELALMLLKPDGAHDRSYTFAELRDLSIRGAGRLASLGVTAGDRVFIMLPRISEWYEVVLGAARLGAIAMPGTVQLATKDIEYRIGAAEAVLAIVDGPCVDAADAARDALPSVSHWVTVTDGEAATGWTTWSSLDEDEGATDADTASNDPLLIYFTSGTTGYPKMVLHTHASYGIGHQITARYWQDLRPGDRIWALSDTGWAKAAWSKLFGQWALGACVVAWNAQGRPNYRRVLEMICDHEVTVFCAPPTIYRNMVRCDVSGLDFSALRHCTAAGEALNADTFHAWEALTGVRIHDGYGQTETVNLLANIPGTQVKPGSLGRPTPGFEVAVVGLDGEPVAAGEEGQIAVKVVPDRPLGLFVEYWRDEEATRSAHLGKYYLTGDRGRVDEDGYFWFVSRDDDVIISAGYRIGPFEVESVLMEHPNVTEVACIGVPDADRGEVVKAYVVPDIEGTPELASELQEFVKQRTAPYKYPRQIAFLDELPKTVSGKIRRIDLRAFHAAGQQA